VESLVDRGTFAIDDSIFVRVPPENPPYPAALPDLVRRGTQDKLLIDGRWFSDKPPVPALFLAGIYGALKLTAGVAAAARPGLFCRVLTILSSGLAYGAAVALLFHLAGRIGLRLPLRLALAGSLGLSTLALPYTRHVNNHILLLGVSMALIVVLQGDEGSPGPMRLLAAGALAGAAYTLDLGIGPVILAATTVSSATRRWPSLSPGAAGLVLLGALPWVVLHHALNFAIGGTLAPANSVLAHLNWPLSPFNARNATGTYQHASLTDFGIYSLSLLFGKRGFVVHDLPLFLPLAGLPILMRRSSPHRPAAIFCLVFLSGGWLVYALFSTNSSGECASIRWFVPLLAPGYWLLALLLRERPELSNDFFALSAWGALIAFRHWSLGPWDARLGAFFWPIAGAALGSWALIAWRRKQNVP
jgi:hypothetical protein